MRANCNNFIHDVQMYTPIKKKTTSMRSMTVLDSKFFFYKTLELYFAPTYVILQSQNLEKKAEK